MNDNLFHNDVDGPLRCASLFSQPCTNLATNKGMISPGASLVLSGDLRLWRNAAAQVDYMDIAFLRGSVPLSLTAVPPVLCRAVMCVVEKPTDLFEAVEWSRPQNANPIGQYVLWAHPRLVFNASTTMEDMPDEHVHAALIYCHNLYVNKDEFDGLTDGEFYKHAAQDPSSRKGANRVVPTHRRSKVRGAVLNDTEDDALN
ncbi:hypothetical protein PHJA_002344700 [Phtheirospermum japonicum]|uniref:Uncharacterized protein n=1 Tax=Phtheirospermum japonicum TaxID=374723 RepID=A0A830CN09_9LAMI|nr:hypothetical protein PHJA_002344700 [Phtheirospermum japonicum]